MHFIFKYLTINWGIYVCVCVSVCLSGYTFPQFSADLIYNYITQFNIALTLLGERI
jgi:hypothetical protein